MKNLALIVAAGKSRRFGKDIPKQYMELYGAPLLRHSILAFSNHAQISAVKVVINEDDMELYNEAVQGLGLLEAEFGGEYRQDSVRMGLEALRAENPDNVLIHDAARPFVDKQIISNVLEGLSSHDGVIPTIDVNDSMRYQGKPIDRSELKIVQTPQGFNYKKLMEAHRARPQSSPNRGEEGGVIYTDDAQLFEAAGGEIFMVEGSFKNKKITREEDLI